MTQPNLKELVARARRERAAPGALAGVARSLRVPFVAAPIATIAVPSSALAGVGAKAGLSRLALLGWGAGSAVVTGGVAAVLVLHEPAPPPQAPPPAAVVQPMRDDAMAKLAQPAEPPPPATVTPSPERHAPTKDAVTTWDEPQLIERARKALATDPRRALSLAQEHQRRFPAGALGVERDVIILEALARSGQTAEARRRAMAFEAKYPSSIHSPRVHALLSRLGSE
jgi:hypothetical protein